MTDSTAQGYVDLLKQTLTGAIHGAHYVSATKSSVKGPWAIAGSVLARRGLELVRRSNREDVELGRVWPLVGETMIGMARLDNLETCIVDVIERGVPGDLIETGVWRGGATIFMRGLLKAHGDEDRSVWVADSFEGVPPPDPERFPADAGDYHYKFDALAVSADDVRWNFRRYGLLDERVRFLEGRFSDTLPSVADNTWAVVRLDGDMYESTMDGLTNLYGGLSAGGYLIVDDYGAVPTCAQAVNDFRSQNDITEPLQRIDWTGVYWRKESNARPSR